MFMLSHVVHRYTLTVWTGQNDTFIPEDLLPYKKEIDISRIYYDLPDFWRTEISMTLQHIASCPAQTHIEKVSGCGFLTLNRRLMQPGGERKVNLGGQDQQYFNDLSGWKSVSPLTSPSITNGGGWSWSEMCSVAPVTTTISYVTESWTWWLGTDDTHGMWGHLFFPAARSKVKKLRFEYNTDVLVQYFTRVFQCYVSLHFYSTILIW